MYIPGKERAIVEESKITDYLLNTGHPDGGGKALYFMAHGYSLEGADTLKEALLAHATSHEVAKLVHTKFVAKYIVDGEVITPRKTKINVRTIWIIALHTDIPKLVTAYPIKP